ncbi:MAG TPA: GWxTD domain-containing protein, partial [candidate division Zixibacteria bacterium]|nr:GWxTD domain-containing protein [candidate division Zixibacteria bacterium]
KNEFYRRVNIANQNFTHMYRQGWRTDRGRVYIMYGEPDQVDDYPVVPDRHPYQEWHYYRGTKYRKFIFVDVNEDGDYRLEYPYDGLYQQPD